MNLPKAEATREVGHTQPGDRVPIKQKVAYGMGGMTEQLANAITGSMFNPVFNIGLGVSPAILGVVQMVFRLWDAVTDPVMGNISDNTRTRWGRRRPYIIGGGVVTAICFPLLWQVSPAWGETTTLVYLVLMGIVFYTCFTTWSMPYYSLGMEMTPDYDERTRIVAWRTFFSKFVSLISGWLMALVALPIFAKAGSSEPDVVRGMSVVSWGIGFLILCTAIAPGLFVKERFYEKAASRQAKIGLWTSMKATLSCRPFLIIVGVLILQSVGGSLVGALGFYLNVYYACQGDLAKASIISGLQGTATFLPGLLSVPLWAWLSEKCGKKGALYLTMILAVIGKLLLLICVTPTNPYLQIIPAIFMSAFGFAIWMIIPSMQADVVDFDELHTHERREGSFSSVFSWSLKLVGTLTTGISGFVLTWTGFDVVKYGKTQPPEVLDRMLTWYVFLPLVFVGVAMLLLWFYPISRERAEGIRSELEARRGKL